GGGSDALRCSAGKIGGWTIGWTVVARAGASVARRAGGAEVATRCAVAFKVRWRGTELPSLVIGPLLAARGIGTGVAPAFGGLNIRSSDGSTGSGFRVATSSISSLTAVDSVFFAMIGPAPAQELRTSRPRRKQKHPAVLAVSRGSVR